MFTVSVLKGQTQPFGVVDTADLKLTSCVFEKDANAMILFNACTAHYDYGALLLEHHIRLKIFNSKANDLGDISIDFPTNERIMGILDLKAETINLNNGKIEVTPLNKKDFYKRKLDKWTSRYTFSFPSLKPGSVLEYSYTQWINFTRVIPKWYFQGKLPVRFSEIKVVPLTGYTLTAHLHVKTEPVVNTDTLVTMANIPSLPEEPFMDAYSANLQSVSFSYSHDAGGAIKTAVKSNWTDIGRILIFGKGYGQQLKIKLKGEEQIIEQAKNLEPKEKIDFIFKKVQELMVCYDNDNLFAEQPVYDAWLRKKGNATEINLIVCRLLTQAGLVTSPMAVSTNPNRRIEQGDPQTEKFDRTVGYVTLNERNYVLDASEKDNKWYQIPFDLLNTYGLYMNVEKPSTGLIMIEDNVPARDAIFVNAEVLPEGKMFGTTQISSFSYNKIDKLLLYDKLGEKKYTESLSRENNDLKIDSIKFQNKEKDTIPLIQNITFKLNLPSSDDSYIYFNPNLFTGLNNNPFLSKDRFTNVDFKYLNNYIISGRYKLPQGYKIEALPKSISLLMPDTSIKFKRIVAEQEGYIMIRYLIDFKKSYYIKEDYPLLFAFYKKMYEMLNEQIILKKS